MRNGKALPTLPDYLREAMARTGMSAAELARRSGASDSQVSRWLAGINRPDVEQLRSVAAAVGVRLLDLVVIAGHLTAEEAGLDEPPPMPAVPEWSREAILELVPTWWSPTSAEFVRSVMRLAWDTDDGLRVDRPGDQPMSRTVRRGIKAARKELGLPQTASGTGAGKRSRKS